MASIEPLSARLGDSLRLFAAWEGLDQPGAPELLEEEMVRYVDELLARSVVAGNPGPYMGALAALFHIALLACTLLAGEDQSPLDVAEWIAGCLERADADLAGEPSHDGASDDLSKPGIAMAGEPPGRLDKTGHPQAHRARRETSESLRSQGGSPLNRKERHVDKCGHSNRDRDGVESGLVQAADTLPEMAAAARESGDVEPLLERIRMAEAVIDAANGPNSTSRSVDAIQAYEERYGDVPGTFVPDW